MRDALQKRLPVEDAFRKAAADLRHDADAPTVVA
jgi:hypothetical protein